MLNIYVKFPIAVKLLLKIASKIILLFGRIYNPTFRMITAQIASPTENKRLGFVCRLPTVAISIKLTSCLERRTVTQGRACPSKEGSDLNVLARSHSSPLTPSSIVRKFKFASRLQLDSALSLSVSILRVTFHLIAMSFGGDARSRGTIRLRTLRPPGVKTLKGMFDKKDLDDEHLALADEAQLDPLLNLLTHDHPTVRALVEEAIMNLEKIDEDEIIMAKRGVQALYKLLTFKDPACQRESIWAIAILAGISEQNHETIKVDIGWLTIVSLARNPQVCF